MRIAIGADHGGYVLKEKIKSADSVNQWIDVGAFNAESSNYAEFAQLVAQKVQSREVDFGIIICRSGIGVSIAANRHKGIYAALCLSNSMAISARTHNNANVLCIAADYTSFAEAQEMIRLFLSTAFEAGGRHEARFKSIDV
ncbi:MAG: RpiB/LacA/LacB family sugar-phosphate isomerase [Alphaproteobacteria bacterium]